MHKIDLDNPTIKSATLKNGEVVYYREALRPKSKITPSGIVDLSYESKGFVLEDDHPGGSILHTEIFNVTETPRFSVSQ
jgi:hypothetical protein